MLIPPPSVQFPVAETDWRRLRRGVDGLKNQIRFAGNVGWAAVGIASSAALFLLGWIATYLGLPKDSQVQSYWVGPVTVVVVFASAAFATLAFVMDYKVSHGLRREADQLLQDMDEIHAPQTTSTSNPVG